MPIVNASALAALDTNVWLDGITLALTCLSLEECDTHMVYSPKHVATIHVNEILNKLYICDATKLSKKKKNLQIVLQQMPNPHIEEFKARNQVLHQACVHQH